MPIMSIEDKRDQLVEELIPFEDHLERLTYVIDRAKDLPGLEDAYKIDTFLIKGCVSQLWIFPSFSDGKCNFQADSEASITKGTASLLCELYSGETPEGVLRLEPDFLVRSESHNTSRPTAATVSPESGKKSRPTPKCSWTETVDFYSQKIIHQSGNAREFIHRVTD